jgi:hypothetical protein
MSNFLFLDAILEEVRDGVHITTDLGKILPNLLGLFAFSFPLFANNLRDIRIIEAGMASYNCLLVVLPIKNKRYKAISG